MAHTTEFSRKLDDLWERRATNLRSLVGLSAKGRPRILTKKLREGGINQLLDLATTILRGRAKDELRKVTRQTRQRHIKGRGADARFRMLYGWAQSNITGPIIYSFWRGKHCIYVGKGKSRGRLKHYAQHIYLMQADLLEIRMVNSKSLLPKAECLAVHLYNPDPRNNKAKPAKEKWGKSCLVCKVHDEIRSELRQVFAM